MTAKNGVLCWIVYPDIEAILPGGSDAGTWGGAPSLFTTSSRSIWTEVATTEAIGVSLESTAIRVAKSSIVIVIFLLHGVGALGLEMAHLLAVRALHASDLFRLSVEAHYTMGPPGGLTVTRLGAFLARMAELVAVTALDVGHVPWLGAILRKMAFLATVAATTWPSLGTILGEVAN